MFPNHHQAPWLLHLAITIWKISSLFLSSCSWFVRKTSNVSKPQKLITAIPVIPAIIKPTKRPQNGDCWQYAKHERKQPKDDKVRPMNVGHLTPLILYRGLA
jgi:hypothetical protein